jgi:hypothetical protein
MENNLSPKIITDFTPEDTIYMTVRSRDGKNENTYLCQFVSYSYGRVTGTKVNSMVNPNLHTHEKGEKITVQIDKCSLYGENPTSKRSYYHHFKTSGYAIYPYEYDLETDDDNQHISKHPSYGLVGITRRHGQGGSPLFGSSILHNDTITLQISAASVDRNLHHEWFHADKELIQIEMSSNQFAEFITTANHGSGVPCTIRHIDRHSMPEPPYVNKKDVFSREFKNKMKNLSTKVKSNLDIAKDILKKPNIGKGDREELARLFEVFVTEVSSNIPFVEQQFVEQMDKTITESKAEIESFVTRRITEEGRKVLFNNPNGDINFLNDPNVNQDETE